MYTRKEKEKKETSTALIVAIILGLSLFLPSHAKAEMIDSTHYIKCMNIERIMKVVVSYEAGTNKVSSAKLYSLNGTVIAVHLGYLNVTIFTNGDRLAGTFKEIFKTCTEVDAI